MSQPDSKEKNVKRYRITGTPPKTSILLPPIVLVEGLFTPAGTDRTASALAEQGALHLVITSYVEPDDEPAGNGGTS